jgi:hypothetical protein
VGDGQHAPRDTIEIVIVAIEPPFDRPIIAGRNRERAPVPTLHDFSSSNDNLAILEDEVRSSKHGGSITKVIINGDIGERARRKLAAIGKAE